MIFATISGVIFGLGLISGMAAAATVSVRPGQDLAAAVKAASSGDVLEISRGFYRVNLLVDKPLSLRGIDRPTLSGGQTGDTIRVTAPDALLRGSAGDVRDNVPRRIEIQDSRLGRTRASGTRCSRAAAWASRRTRRRFRRSGMPFTKPV